MFRAGASDLVRVALGSVLMLAAMLKWLQSAGDPSGGDASSPVWVASIVAEVLLSAWLISGLYSLLSRYAALAAFFVFAMAAFAKALAGDASCGCFGRAAVSPWLTLAFDLIAIALLAKTRRGSEMIAPSPVALRFRLAWVAMASASIACLAVAVDYTVSTLNPIVVLEPEAWIGRRWPLLDEIDVGPQLAGGPWTVVLVHEDCSDCREVIAGYRRLGHASSITPAAACAVIYIPPVRPGAETSIAGCLIGRLSGERRWFVKTPLMIHLENGVVTGSATGLTR